MRGMTDQPKITPIEPAGLADENALLRASIGDLRERLAEFEQMADRDPLTRLANHRRLVAELDRVVAKAHRYGITGALVLVDLDNMPAIADRHGSLAGDAVLIHAARTIESLIRSTDVAARIGPARFVIILDYIDHESAIDAAERISRCIAAEPVELGGARASLEVSLGIASLLPGDVVEELLARAEANLERAREDA